VGACCATSTENHLAGTHSFAPCFKLASILHSRCFTRSLPGICKILLLPFQASGTSDHAPDVKGAIALMALWAWNATSSPDNANARRTSRA